MAALRGTISYIPYEGTSDHACMVIQSSDVRRHKDGEPRWPRDGIELIPPG